MTTTDYLDSFKLLLGVSLDDESKDGRLLFTIESVIQAVKTYCGITSIPKALDLVILQIAEDYYRSKYATEFEQTAASIVSVKRGDVQTNFGSAKPAVKVGSGSDFVNNYAAQLNAFRKLRW